MNSWFPKLRADGVMASGNAGIWLTPLSGSARQIDAVGTNATWAGQMLVFNRNDGTSHVGVDSVPAAYNEYAGSDDGQWAGFISVGAGSIDRYLGRQRVGIATLSACAPRFYGGTYGYLTPFQSSLRALIVGGVTVANGIILDWTADRGGCAYTYTVGVGTYGKRIFDNAGNDITIRPQLDEAPQVIFLGLDGYPWLVSQTTNSGTFVRMFYSAFGYRIEGDLFYPDARLIGDRLHVVGSTGNGQPRDIWIDFSAPKQDLRIV